MRRVVQTLAGESSETGGIEDQEGAQAPGRTGAAPARPEPMRTEFDFELPRGLGDANGMVHKEGTMRLATARDELLPLHDDRVRDNPAYLTVVLLARVITRIGTLTDEAVNASV